MSKAMAIFVMGVVMKATWFYTCVWQVKCADTTYGCIVAALSGDASTTVWAFCFTFMMSVCDLAFCIWPYVLSLKALLFILTVSNASVYVLVIDVVTTLLQLLTYEQRLRRGRRQGFQGGNDGPQNPPPPPADVISMRELARLLNSTQAQFFNHMARESARHELTVDGLARQFNRARSNPRIFDVPNREHGGTNAMDQIRDPSFRPPAPRTTTPIPGQREYRDYLRKAFLDRETPPPDDMCSDSKLYVKVPLREDADFEPERRNSCN